MIVSKPKVNTITALSLFVLLTFGSFFLLLHSLLSNGESLFWVKMVLTPVVLAIGLLVMGKLLAALKVVRLGKNRIDIFYPLTRMKVSLEVQDILGWREEAIKTKNGEFREVKVLYGKKKILTLSNKENTEYDKVVGYLRQKVKVEKR